MQERHLDSRRYFEELTETTGRYILPFIETQQPLRPGMEVLEIGCGEGGNLKPFREAGCRVTGLDINAAKIEAARKLLSAGGEDDVRFFCANFLVTEPDRLYDLVFVHDVIEHITDKKSFLDRIKVFLKPEGIVYFAFPAWQMPFGGHQQICRNRLASRLPFMHLLPKSVYRGFLRTCKESQPVIDELLDIKECKTPIGLFKRLVKGAGYRIVREQLYFINPHYEVKFGLRPRRLTPWIGKIPGVNNFFSTSCFYLLRPE